MLICVELVRNSCLLLMDWNFKELLVIICSGWDSEKNKFLLSLGSLTNPHYMVLDNAESD